MEDVSHYEGNVSMQWRRHAHRAVSPSHVTVSPSHVTVSPSHVTVSPSHVTVSPSHVENNILEEKSHVSASFRSKRNIHCYYCTVFTIAAVTKNISLSLCNYGTATIAYSVTCPCTSSKYINLRLPIITCKCPVWCLTMTGKFKNC